MSRMIRVPQEHLVDPGDNVLTMRVPARARMVKLVQGDAERGEHVGISDGAQ